MSKCKIPYVVDDDGKPGQVCHAVRGCKEKSRGCRNCYAANLAATRLSHLEAYEGLAVGHPCLPEAQEGEVFSGPRWIGEVRLFPEELSKPLRRRNPTTWFVADMGDLFYEEVPDGYILRVFEAMAMARTQRFLVLTKRPERLAQWLARWADVSGEPMEFQGVRGPEATRKAHLSPRGQMFASYLETLGEPPPGCAFPTFDWLEGMRRWPPTWYLPNVWFGVSAEGRKELLERVPQLLRLDGGRAEPGGLHCAGFWLSAEPQLEDFGDISECLAPVVDWKYFAGPSRHGSDPSEPWDGPCDHRRPRLSWIVQGSEQLAGGRNGRHFDPAWAASLLKQIQEAITPADLPDQSRVTAWERDAGPRLHYFYKQAPGPGGKVDKLPELYGRTWRQVPWQKRTIAT